MISLYLTAILAIACTLKNSSASNLSTGTVIKTDSSTRIREASLINLLAKPTGKLLTGYFTYIGYSDPDCKFVSTATSSKLNTCTPSSVGSSFILTANSTTLFTAVYADLSCSSSDFYAPSSFALQVCGPGYRSYLLTPSLPEVKSSEPLLLSRWARWFCSILQPHTAIGNMFSCPSSAFTAIPAPVARQCPSTKNISRHQATA